MAVSHNWYASSFITMANKEADWDTDTVKCMLTTSAYTWNQNTHKYKSDITNEITGTNYVAGGATISPLTSAVATLVWNLTGSNAVWANATITARYAVVYDSTPGTDATRPLLSRVDFGAD